MLVITKPSTAAAKLVLKSKTRHQHAIFSQSTVCPADTAPRRRAGTVHAQLGV